MCSSCHPSYIEYSTLHFHCTQPNKNCPSMCRHMSLLDFFIRWIFTSFSYISGATSLLLAMSDDGDGRFTPGRYHHMMFMLACLLEEYAIKKSDNLSILVMVTIIIKNRQCQACPAFCTALFIKLSEHHKLVAVSDWRPQLLCLYNCYW